MPMFGSEAESRKPLFGAGAKKPSKMFGAGGEDKQAKLDELEAAASEALKGSFEFAPGTKSLGRIALDLISRPGYASAGAAEELLSKKGRGPKAAVKRVGRELLSGIGDIKGEKKAFGQVMEEAGVPKLGQVSDVFPGLYSETGKGLPLEKGGLFDPTGRGTAGLAADIFLDPSTYVTLGTGAATKIGPAGARQAVSKKGFKALQEAMRPALDDIARKGITGEERVLAQRLARVDAEGRVLAAAATDPRLLDKGGIKFMGTTIPGTPKIATLASGVSSTAVEALGRTRAGAAALEATRQMRPLYDNLGAVFNRDWHIRNLPAYQELKQAHLDLHAFQTDELHKAIAASPVADIPKARWEEFIDNIEDGSWKVKYANDPKMLEAGRDFVRFNDEWAALETASGMLPKTRPNYAAHFYKNRPEEIAHAVYAAKKPRLNMATVGRHAEERAFDTLKQAREFSETFSKMPNSQVVPLRPIYNPVEILRRRGEAHVDAMEFRRYYTEVRDKFAKQDLPFSPDDYFDLARQGAQISPEEFTKIHQAIAKGGTDPKFVQGLTKEGRQEFMRLRLLQVKDPLEIIHVLNKYGPEDVPRMKSLIGQAAEDGSPYVSFNVPLFKDVEIPKSIADDMAELSDRVLKSKDFTALGKIWDAGNNAFKSGVTVLFPAFHFRNAYSNVAMSMVDIGVAALNPVRHAQAIQIMRGKAGEFVTKLGERYSYDDIRRMLGELQVEVSGRNVLEHVGEEGKIAKRGLKSKIKGLPRTVGGATETEARTQLFLTHLRRGLSPEQAAARTKEFLYDYSKMSSAEKNYFSRYIPFYRFTRKNVERQLKNLAYRPGIVAAEAKPFMGRNNENEQMASWDSDALKIRLNSDGKTLRVLSGVDLPIRGLDVVWRGNLKETGRMALGMASPFLKAPIEYTMGSSLFTGTEQKRTESAAIGRLIETLDPPQGLKNWLGYAKEFDKAGRTHYTFDRDKFYPFFQSWVLSRFVSTSDRAFKTYAESGWGPVFLDIMTGLRDKTMNLSEENERRINERTKLIEDLLVRKGKMKEFRRTYTPKGQ